jgi:hypothetical protein
VFRAALLRVREVVIVSSAMLESINNVNPVPTILFVPGERMAAGF